MWSIAAQVVSRERGRAARPAETITYWTALINANRDRLHDPDDPHLIYPGQVFRLPDLSAAAPPPRSPATGPKG
jgi:hypothetical protein